MPVYTSLFSYIYSITTNTTTTTTTANPTIFQPTKQFITTTKQPQNIVTKQLQKSYKNSPVYALYMISSYTLFSQIQEQQLVNNINNYYTS